MTLLDSLGWGTPQPPTWYDPGTANPDPVAPTQAPTAVATRPATTNGAVPSWGGLWGNSNTPTASRPIGSAATTWLQRANAWGQPAGQQLDLRRQQLDANGGIIDLMNPSNRFQSNVWNSGQNLFDAQGRENNASRGVLDATGRYNGANRSVINAEGANNQASQAEFERELSARNDVEDQANVGLYDQYLGNNDRLSSMFGVAPETRITLPPGVSSANLPSGTVAAGRTNAEQVNETNQVARARRGFSLDSLRNNASLAGADVTDANLRRSYAGADVSDASLAHSRAGADLTHATDQADYESRVLGHRLDIAQQQPYPGAKLWEDKNTGESKWVSSADYDRLNVAYQTQLYQQRQQSRLSLPQLQGATRGQLQSWLGQVDPQTGQPIVDEATVRAELTRRGFSKELIDSIIADGTNNRRRGGGTGAASAVAGYDTSAPATSSAPAASGGGSDADAEALRKLLGI